MKLLVLVLAVLAFAPFAAPVPPGGQGDAAAAVAAAGLGAVPDPLPGTQEGTVFFTLSGSGTIVHPHGVTPGLKPFKNKVKLAQITDCIAGTALGCDAGTIEVNAGDPTAYLFFDGLTSWRLATNANGDDATTLTGLVDGKGGFLFTGSHVLSGTEFVLSGKVKFEKGTFNPKKISGKISAVAVGQEHYGTGTFKSTGPLAQ